MTGTIGCLGPDLGIPFEAQSASGTRIDTLARFSLQRTGSMEARVSGFIPQDFQYALPIAGFVPDGSTFVYRYPAAPFEVQP
jgi:general secretion pathway protein N